MSEASLIRGGFVLTSDEPDVIENGAVRVLKGVITDVGTWEDLRSRFPDDTVYGGRHDIVTPGFVNTHGHFSEGLITGIAKEHTLWEWIGALIGPVAPFLTFESAYSGTLIAGMQMLKSGITTANDMFVCDPGDNPTTPGVVAALDDLGLRGVVSFGAGDVRGASVAAIMAEHEALAEAARGSKLSQFRVGIAALGAQSSELFAASVELANTSGAGSHIHLQEIREEVTAIRQLTGVTPIEHSARSGLFDAPTIAAHCVWVDRFDREILAEHGVGVAHNPVSNMILASGICPVPELLRMGIAVGTGVDGPASNDRQDMMEAIKSSVLIQRLRSLRATELSAREALTMATIGGARALGLDAQLGSLTPGKAADVVVFDGDDAALGNVFDPFSSIVFAAGPGQIKEVWVDGQRSVIDGAVATVDEKETVAKSRPLARDLAERAGVLR